MTPLDFPPGTSGAGAAVTGILKVRGGLGPGRSRVMRSITLVLKGKVIPNLQFAIQIVKLPM